MKTELAGLTNTELESLISDATAELAKRTHTVPPPTKLRYAESFSSYNARRYSRPWIARISAWPVGGKAEMQFGSYLGNDGGGEVEIMAMPGDIIRYGQKDGRGNGGMSEWAIAQADGSLTVVDQAEARKAYKAAL